MGNIVVNLSSQFATICMNGMGQTGAGKSIKKNIEARNI